MNKETIDLIVKVSQGNPECARVLSDIAIISEEFAVIVCTHMMMTGTPGHQLWQLYKDQCNLSKDDTFIALDTWCHEKPIKTLADYFDKVVA